MNLNIDEIIELARSFEQNGEMPEVLEEFLNLLAEKDFERTKEIKHQEEFGEDLTCASVKVLEKEGSRKMVIRDSPA